MKAIIHEAYGPPSALYLDERPRPVPKENEVLLRIKATSVNSWDWDQLRGEELIIRLIGGVFKPRLPILGIDIAGEVVEIGSKVTDFAVGDHVFGDLSAHGWGGFAEYVAVSEAPLALIPKELTFEQAAALPHAGALALQGLRYGRGIQTGDQVLINGAGGGAGTIAIQLAKQVGATVTAVDRKEKLAELKDLGADHVIDYLQEDYTRNTSAYDFILDMVASKPPRAYANALRPGGALVMVGGSMWSLFRVLLENPWYRVRQNKHLTILPHEPRRADLEELARRCVSGELKPIIHKMYPLEQAAEAMSELGAGKSFGKVIIQNI